MLNTGLDRLSNVTEGRPTRIYFVHIRKTAGTSLNHMFLSLESCQSDRLYRLLSEHFTAECNGRIYTAWDKTHIARGEYYYGFSHHPVYSLQIPSNTFVFSCFRDPVKRVLSLYNMLRTMKEENSDHPGMKEQGPWLGNSFSDFLDRAPYREIANQLFMFSHRFDIQEAIARTRHLSYFFFTEAFAQGVTDLNDQLGINLSAIHVRKAEKKYNIEPDQLERLVKMLEPEYQFIELLKEEYKRRFEKEYSSP